MDDELARELQLATSELLDLDLALPSSSLLASPPLLPPSAAPSRPLVAIPASTFSPGSKLEPVYSPTDVRPVNFGWSKCRNGHRPDSSTSPDAKAAPNDSDGDDDDQLLPNGGLSSRMGSVRGEPPHSITLTHHLDQVHPPALEPSPDLDLDTIHGEPHASALNPRPRSKLWARLPFDDIYLNEYGERVVNGKVVGRVRGGRRRSCEASVASDLPEAQDAESIRNKGMGSSLDLPSTPANILSPLSSPSRSRDESLRLRTPPAFFLQSFPDVLDPLKGPPSATSTIFTTTVSDASAAAHGETSRSGSSVDQGEGPQLQAPKPTARALDFGGDDDDDDGFGACEGRNGTYDSKAATGLLWAPPLDPVTPKTSALSALEDTDPASTRDEPIAAVTLPTTLRPKNEGGGSIDRPNSRNSVVSITRRSAASGSKRSEKLELPSISRRATPTIEVSVAQTEHLPLHGNKLQALRSGLASPRADSGQGSVPAANAGARAKSPSFGKRIENLFHTPLVPPREEEGWRDEHGADGSADLWNLGRSAGVGVSASLPPSPTFRSKNAVFAGAKGDHKDDDGGDNASLDSLPASLLSLPVSTLTSSSHAPSTASIGASSLERRRSGSAHDGGGAGLRRRRSGRRPEEAGAGCERFARDVRIRGWKEVGGQARGWVVFEIRIITKQGTSITIFRRFSSFVTLRQTLAQEFKDKAKWLPPLPSRRTGLLHKYDARYLESRRKALQAWLEVVMLDRVWGASDGLQGWVLEGE
ncbi:hypothetical protein ACQY0O_005909 [Thecaphora frezii]